jgi:hypothetical protein
LHGAGPRRAPARRGLFQVTHALSACVEEVLRLGHARVTYIFSLRDRDADS